LILFTEEGANQKTKKKKKKENRNRNRNKQQQVDTGAAGRNMKSQTFSVLAIVVAFLSYCSALSDKPNVLLITADDLNNWSHYAGNSQVVTPNLDRLFSMGVFFNRSYANAPACNPSRASFMSSLRPSSTGVYDNDDDWRTVLPEEKMLTTAFRNAGYSTLGAGKIYHVEFSRPSEWDYYLKKYDTNCPFVPEELFNEEKLEFGPLLCDDNMTEDYRIISYGIEQLSKTHDKPMFLALGFRKPHLPWYVPKKYFDMYPLESVKLPATISNDLDDLPIAGVRLASSKLHEELVKRDLWTRAVRAYLATITFVDTQVGRLLDALEQSPLKNDTIVVFLGDHGYHLGEKKHWTKFTLWEEATRAPLAFIVPGVTQPGQICDRTVEFLSIYPTLLDLCGLPIPNHVEGTSFKKLLVKPKSSWDFPAISTWRPNNHAVRNETWRYIQYHDGGEELYNEKIDPHEWKNLLFADTTAESQAAKTELIRFFPEKNKKKLTPEKQKEKPMNGTKQHDNSDDNSDSSSDTGDSNSLGGYSSTFVVVALAISFSVAVLVGVTWFARKKLAERLLEVIPSSLLF